LKHQLIAAMVSFQPDHHRPLIKEEAPHPYCQHWQWTCSKCRWCPW